MSAEAPRTLSSRKIVRQDLSSSVTDYVLKLVVIGESGVGKTNLLSRFTCNEFSSDTKSTIGVEFATPCFWLDGRSVKLQIWDTAGQERYRALSSAYYRGAMGCMLVYDVTNRRSFAELTRWLQEVEEYGDDDIVITVVGNKCDLEQQRIVSKEEGAAFCAERQLLFAETSARNATNVDEVLLEMMSNIYTIHALRDLEKRDEARETHFPTIVLNSAQSPGKGSKKRKCC